jgi:methylated-DNA-protein-cysteine methyltransferase related protein
MGKIFDKIYEEVKKIPRGQTSSYKDIAKKANTTPRVVGFALHKNPDPENIPCHRVVFQNGEASAGYVFGGKSAQEKKLFEEKNSFC